MTTYEPDQLRELLEMWESEATGFFARTNCRHSSSGGRPPKTPAFN